MRPWIPIDALWWLMLYGAFGVLVPLLLRWTQKGRKGLDTSFRRLFKRGELGLFGLLLAISAMLDVRRSSLPALLMMSNFLILGAAGFMSASAWFMDYSRVADGLSNQDHRTWLDSRRLLFLVLSVAFTTEVLLAHSAQGAWQ